MVAPALPLLLLLQAPVADTAAAAFVARLRQARDRNERLVTAYTTRVSQRVGVGLRALSRDRMLYRQELVARIAWKRDESSTIEVLGAREGVPVAFRGDRLPEDLRDDLPGLVFNPAQDQLRLLGGSSSNEGFVYPLREGGEADYVFAAGDTTVITLPGGRTIRLAALHVTPRRSDWRLLAGTLWFDADTHGLVRMVVRPARPYEFRRDAEPEDRRGVPAFVNPRAEVRFITMEYGLYEARWWLPRYVAIDAVGTMGSWLGLPVRIERIYDDYEVEGGSPPPAGSTFRPAGTLRRLEPGRPPPDSAERRRIADSVRTAIDACVAERAPGAVPTDSLARRIRPECRRALLHPNLVVHIPADTAALLASAELGPPILAMGDLLTTEELRGLAEAIGRLPAPLWMARVELPRGAGALLQHARYNRVEALSVGISGRLDLGRAELRGLARLGVADLEPNGELALARSSGSTRVGIAAYRRLAAANPETRPFGVGNSTMALFAQRDDGEYFRTLGVELVAGNTDRGWWNARVYAERQRPALVETHASVPRLFDRDRTFRPNLVADTADQVGGEVTLRGTRALSATITVGADLTAGAGAGTRDFGKGAMTLRGFFTPAGPLSAAVALSAGTSTGTVPAQSRFYLGGAPTLRGYSGGAAAGDAYWATRVEVGTSFPAARIILFGDAGWAGDRAGWRTGRPLTGAGVGAGLLDGLIRMDLARGLRAPGGWRLEFYVDGLL